MVEFIEEDLLVYIVLAAVIALIFCVLAYDSYGKRRFVHAEFLFNITLILAITAFAILAIIDS